MSRIVIVTAEFYPDIAEALLQGARAELKKHSAVVVEEVMVPGALEIPFALQMALDTGFYDGAIALGCVIRGETSHYDIVCNESAHALMQLGLHTGLPITNGILTVENHDQAWSRAQPSQMNKGGAVAKACISMIRLADAFDEKMGTGE